MSSLLALRMERTQSLQLRAPVSRGVEVRARATPPAPMGPPRLVPKEVLAPKETMVAARGLTKRWDAEVAAVYVPGVVAVKAPAAKVAAAAPRPVVAMRAMRPREMMVTRHQTALNTPAAAQPEGLSAREVLKPREALAPRHPSARSAPSQAFKIAIDTATQLLSSARSSISMEGLVPREQLVSRHETALRATEGPKTLAVREQLVPRGVLAPREALVARTQCKAVDIGAARAVMQQFVSSLATTAPVPREQLVSRHETALRATEGPKTLAVREQLVPREVLAPREALVARTQCKAVDIGAARAVMQQFVSSLATTAPVPREQLVSRHETALRAPKALAVREQLVPRDVMFMVSRAPSVRDELTGRTMEAPVVECDVVECDDEEAVTEVSTGGRRKSMVTPLAPAAVGVDPEGIPMTPMLSALADPDDMGFLTPLSSAMDATPLTSMPGYKLPAVLTWGA